MRHCFCQANRKSLKRSNDRHRDRTRSYVPGLQRNLVRPQNAVLEQGINAVSLVCRLVGTPPEAKGGQKKAKQGAQPMASIPEAIYCSAPQIRYMNLDLHICRAVMPFLE